MLERLAHIGPGARAAGERRRVIERLEEQRKDQRQAYIMAHRERGLARIGRVFVP